MTVENPPRSRFGVTADFTGGQAVLAVRGAVDAFGAPVLGALIDASVARGYPSVLVDLAEVDGVDELATSVLARAARRLAVADGGLTVRASPDVVGLIRSAAGLVRWIRFEPTHGRPGFVATEQPARGPGSRAGVAQSNVVDDLLRMRAVPFDDDAVDGVLRLVVALARAAVGGADGVSVSLRRRGQLSTVAASDRTIQEMDKAQYGTGEGPCVDASRRGRSFLVGSLDDETRWPAFIPRARQLGINAILSTPLLVADRPVGALNIYSRTAEAFTPKDRALASVFGAEASTVVTDAGLAVTGDQLADRLGAALRTRQVIAQAQGVVMEWEQLSAEAAYDLLRDFSRGSGRPLLERAEDVVASTQGSRSDPVAVPGSAPRIVESDRGREQPADATGSQRTDCG